MKTKSSPHLIADTILFLAMISVVGLADGREPESFDSIMDGLHKEAVDIHRKLDELDELDRQQGNPSAADIRDTPLPNQGILRILDPRYYRWDYNRSDQIQRLSKSKEWVSYSIDEIAERVQLSSDLDNLVHTVVLGMASCEGDDKSQEKLARERADKVAQAISKDTRLRALYTLNLGRYTADCPDSRTNRMANSEQRKVVLVGLPKIGTDSSLAATVAESLRKGIDSAGDGLGFQPGAYSNFEKIEKDPSLIVTVKTDLQHEYSGDIPGSPVGSAARTESRVNPTGE